MAIHKCFLVLFISALSIFTMGLSAEVNDGRKDYIVYLGRATSKYSVTSQHLNILQQVVQDISAEEAIIRSYKRSINGFAARLTQTEYENLKTMKEVVSVFPSRTLQLQTTRSWDFIGLPPPSRQQKLLESDVIIGVLDTGVWPASPSFADLDAGPIPKKWKGVCNGGLNFTCNRKVIGARVYIGKTARDDEGHGSHTASTAAGQIVPGTSYFGIANGTARGGVPSARIAVYKVCDKSGCQDDSILAAFDDAIADGVDFITISIGGQPAELYEDTIAIGALHAMLKGVLTMHSAGNDGDNSGTTGSVAPWVFSVTASSTDRRIIDKVVLGNGNTLIGSTVNSFDLRGERIPLVYGKEVTTKCSEANAKLCSETCLDKNLVKGKIVVCDGLSPYAEAFKAGAGGVLARSGMPNVSFAYPLPAAPLATSEFAALKAYLNTTKTPTAKILKSESIVDTNAPTVPVFASRGPNLIAPDILKPDISAPGVDILAAYSSEANILKEYPNDKRSVTHNILSGTSMACPHVAGAAAYVKSVHPDWSPSAIKSSLMTTADPMSSARNTDAEFAYGSGHVNPIKATNPGLVYESTQDDLSKFLCGLGYATSKIAAITGNITMNCPMNRKLSPNDVNYPSLSALVVAEKPFLLKFRRTVTNVGLPNSTYTAQVQFRKKIRVKVEPSTLSFKSLKETQSFIVTVSGKGFEPSRLVSTSLVWTDGVHSVRSPVVVYAFSSSLL
ncbi:hypothetical protein vseg_010102 [Gypsophila vaccaria]